MAWSYCLASTKGRTALIVAEAAACTAMFKSLRIPKHTVTKKKPDTRLALPASDSYSATDFSFAAA